MMNIICYAHSDGSMSQENTEKGGTHEIPFVRMEICKKQ